MQRILAFFLWVPVLAAQPVATYIVELAGQPVAARLAGSRARGRVHSPEAVSMRALVRAEQLNVRTRIAAEEAEVVDQVDTVANALIVRATPTRAGRLRQLPGVKAVHAAREFKMILDRATVLHKAPEAWAKLGLDNAGAGIRIAIIDSGIDVSHAAFQDPSLRYPDGFPKVNASSDAEFTNGKVIVARSYASLFSRRDPDPSARDRVGHGTAVAAAAAAVVTAGPLATIQGMAPKAQLGSYKVFGTPGVNDGAPEAALLKAIEDAVNDGMDILNLSLGSDLPPRTSDDIFVEALEQASSLGVLVVVASGNNGPDAGTIGSPATAPSVLSVGASLNDRVFGSSIRVGESQYVALPGDGPNPERLEGPLADIAAADSTMLACSPLPAGSLSGKIALIYRGECTFEEKLNHVQRAGAIAGIIYTRKENPELAPWTAGAATLPGEMITFEDAAAIKQQLAESETVQATLSFAVGPQITSTAGLATFSTRGPNVDLGVKPELVATGTNIYTPTQSFDPSGDMYSRNGFIDVDGTSFASPLVAGAAALVMAAHPGLTVAQYRSLLINSTAPAVAAPGVPARVQQAGAGVLDAAAAVSSTVTAAPAILHFGAGGGDVDAARSLTLTNIGTAAETYLIEVQAFAGGPAPEVSRNTVELAPGASEEVTVTFRGATLEPGAYEGFLRITSSSNPVETRIPYWYAATSDIPAGITLLSVPESGRSGSVVFRVTDSAGVPIVNASPEAVTVAGGAIVSGITSIDSSIPGAFRLSYRFGLRGGVGGTSVLRIRAGDVTRDVTLQGQ